MNARPHLKQPKIENEAEEQEEREREVTEEKQNRKEQEEALVALIEHRTKEVEHLRQRLAYYKSQLDESEKRLEDTQSKLARHRGQDNVMASEISKNVTKEALGLDTINSSGDNLKSRKSASPFHQNGEASRCQIQSKPQHLVPVTPKMEECGNKATDGSGSLPGTSLSTHINSIAKQKGDKARRLSSDQEIMQSEPKGKKTKLEQKEHKDLIPLISSCSSSTTIRCQTGCLLSSQHKRKLRSLVLCPTNNQLFVTSALDGLVNLWQVQGRGSSANLLSTTECQSNKQRRWPEDIAWHPQGDKLFSVYAADGGDSQISILNLNKGKDGTRVSFLEDKPHIKGIINSIVFLPWDETRFVTGGSDHAVILWTEQDSGRNSWIPKSLHRNFHSSAVMGVAGLQHKNVVISVGADKRIIGFDVMTGRADYKHQIESKCMSIVTNPADFNLFMVQTGTPERQLKLFDFRVRQIEIHAFGWKQESSDSQSALINQAWSPDGLYITSGSADPAIHIFDIRYNGHKPSQSIRAHQKRVFKAVWHHALPLLISISSDLNIGLHKIL